MPTDGQAWVATTRAGLVEPPGVDTVVEPRARRGWSGASGAARPPHDQALGIIAAAAGTHLDADVVDVLCAHLAQVGLAPVPDADPAPLVEAAHACHTPSGH